MKIAVLVSAKGTGSNLKAIIQNGFKVHLVLADRESPGIQIAKENKIPTKILPYNREDTEKKKYRDQYCSQLVDVLNRNKIDLVVLAGFNRILSKVYFKKFKGPTINIHPGAIPDRSDEEFIYRGVKIPWNRSTMTDEAVTNFLGKKYACSTIHIVTEEADFGPVLKRVFVRVLKNDTVETLYKRLKEAENRGLIEILKSPDKII